MTATNLAEWERFERSHAFAPAPLAMESLHHLGTTPYMVTPVGFEPDTSGLRGLRLNRFD